MKRILRLLRRSNAGSVAVEFALIGPTMLAMVLGVFQIGVAMQNYNAIRSVAMDTERHVVVEYQTNDKLTNAQITQWARGRATVAPYILESADLLVTTTDDTSQPVTGATQKTLSIRYTIPTFLGWFGIDSYYIYYTRKIFVPD